METLTDKVEILILADFRNGRTKKEFKGLINKCIKEEKYEICEGIKRAINKQK